VLVGKLVFATCFDEGVVDRIAHAGILVDQAAAIPAFGVYVGVSADHVIQVFHDHGFLLVSVRV